MLCGLVLGFDICGFVGLLLCLVGLGVGTFCDFWLVLGYAVLRMVWECLVIACVCVGLGVWFIVLRCGWCALLVACLTFCGLF